MAIDFLSVSKASQSRFVWSGRGVVGARLLLACSLLFLTVPVSAIEVHAPLGEISDPLTIYLPSAVVGGPNPLNVSLPQPGIIQSFHLTVGTPDDVNQSPLAATLQVDGLETPSWSFGGQGLGALGYQQGFEDGSSAKEGSIDGTGMAISFLLPREALSVDARLQLSPAVPSEAWWDLNWSWRSGMVIEPSNGRDQSPQVVEVGVSVSDLPLTDPRAELRMTWVDPASGVEELIPCQVHQTLPATAPFDEVAILFEVPPLEADGSQQFWLYGGNPGAIPLAEPPDYHPDAIVHNIEIGRPTALTLQAAGGTGPFAFDHPQEATLDLDGTLFVADTMNDRVLSLAPDLQTSSQWGQTDTCGTGELLLCAPSGIELLPTGLIAVVDKGDTANAGHRVVFYDEAREEPPTMWLGDNGTPGNFNWRFDRPTSIAGDPTDSYPLLVADTNNHRLLWFDDLVNRGSEGQIGQTDVSGSDLSHFNHPAGVTIDGTGMLFVADQDNSRVLAFAQPTDPMAIGADGSGLLSTPRDVATVDDHLLLVSDPARHVIREFEYDLINGLTLAGTRGSVDAEGLQPDQFSAPQGITVSSGGTIIVADTGNSRVILFQPLHATQLATQERPVPTDVAVVSVGGMHAVSEPIVDSIEIDLSELLSLTPPEEEFEDGFGNEFAQYLLTLSGTGDSPVHLGLTITYSWERTLDLTDDLQRGLEASFAQIPPVVGGEVRIIPIRGSSTNDGRMTISNPTLLVDLPPLSLRPWPTEVTLLEDSAPTSLIELDELVGDLEGDLNCTILRGQDLDSRVQVELTADGGLRVNLSAAANLTGSGTLRVRCLDSEGQPWESAPFALVIIPVNDPPVLTRPQFIPAAEVGRPWHLQIPFTDAEGGEFSLETIDGPAWMDGRVIADDGVVDLSGTPDASSVGTLPIELTVNDGSDLGQLAFSINVTWPGGATIKPIGWIPHPSTTEAFPGEEVTIALQTEDATAETTYSLDSASPAGARLVPQGLGVLLSWSPTLDDVGDHVFNVTATERGVLGSTVLSVMVRTPDPMFLRISGITQGARTNRTPLAEVRVTVPQGTLTELWYTIEGGPATPLPLLESQQVQINLGQRDGFVHIRFHASSSTGREVEQAFLVEVGGGDQASFPSRLAMLGPVSLWWLVLVGVLGLCLVAVLLRRRRGNPRAKAGGASTSPRKDGERLHRSATEESSAVVGAASVEGVVLCYHDGRLLGSSGCADEQTGPGFDRIIEGIARAIQDPSADLSAVRETGGIHLLINRGSQMYLATALHGPLGPGADGRIRSLANDLLEGVLQCNRKTLKAWSGDYALLPGVAPALVAYRAAVQSILAGPSPEGIRSDRVHLLGQIERQFLQGRLTSDDYRVYKQVLTRGGGRE